MLGVDDIHDEITNLIFDDQVKFSALEGYLFDGTHAQTPKTIMEDLALYKLLDNIKALGIICRWEFRDQWPNICRL